jgi:hypothetical protein
MQHKKREKVIEFFDVYGPELHGKPEWSQWFGNVNSCVFQEETNDFG